MLSPSLLSFVETRVVLLKGMQSFMKASKFSPLSNSQAFILGKMPKGAGILTEMVQTVSGH